MMGYRHLTNLEPVRAILERLIAQWLFFTGEE